MKKTSALPTTFIFLEPGKLVDGELELALIEKTPAKPKKKYDPCYVFEMRHAVTTEKMGAIRLRIGVFYGDQLEKFWGHIGYDVDAPFRGKHFAARACRLLFPFAKQHGMKELWITCNPDNVASRKTCELAGATFVEIVDIPVESESYKKGERQKCRYRIDL